VVACYLNELCDGFQDPLMAIIISCAESGSIVSADGGHNHQLCRPVTHGRMQSGKDLLAIDPDLAAEARRSSGKHGIVTLKPMERHHYRQTRQKPDGAMQAKGTNAGPTSPYDHG
jgi:hypothetical protein